MKLEEQKAIRLSDLDGAQDAHASINDLREKEILLRNYMIVEENQRAVNLQV